MSRRSQSRRRRSYGRRQHEVRERRLDTRPAGDFLGGVQDDFEIEWHATDGADDRAGFGDAFGGYGR